MNQRKKWATREAAKAHIFQAERRGNMGLSYCAACDFLGWNVQARREYLEACEKARRASVPLPRWKQQ